MYSMFPFQNVDEFLACIALHRKRGKELGLEHLAVLEVGAGDGRLTAHLQAALAQLRPATSCCSVDLRCSDSGLCGLHECSPFRYKSITVQSPTIADMQICCSDVGLLAVLDIWQSGDHSFGFMVLLLTLGIRPRIRSASGCCCGGGFG